MAAKVDGRMKEIRYIGQWPQSRMPGLAFSGARDWCLRAVEQAQAAYKPNQLLQRLSARS